MWARVTRINGAPFNIDTVVSRISELFIPAVEEKPGFSGAFVLANRKNSQLMTISLWRDNGDIETSHDAAASWITQATQALPNIVPPEVEIYEAVYLPMVPNPQPSVSISFRPGNTRFARVTRIKGISHEIDAVIRYFREVTVPIVERLPGYSGTMLFVDREHGKIMGITIWLTEADLIASTEAVSLQRTRISTLFAATEPPEIELYEIEPLPAQVPG